MISIDSMLVGQGRWFGGSGPRADEILSTRVRLARNIRDARFVARCREEELSDIFQRVGAALRGSTSLKGGMVRAVEELGVLDRQFLLERHLVSHDMAAEARHRGVAVGPDESLSVMVNEEDHLRIQSLRSGLDLEGAWRAAGRLDDELSASVAYAYHDEFGYLTACPTNVGTGMRASVLVHLPALVLTQRIKKVLAGITQVGFTVRGFHGEGSDVIGNFFQVSNQVTLGVTEASTLEKLQGIVLQVLDMEAKARESLLRDARVQIEDKICRAYATLRYARLLSTQECMGILSAIRFGVTLGMAPLPDTGTLNALLLYTQPAHLQKLAGRELSSSARNEYRAAWIQERLKVTDAPRPGNGTAAGGRDQ